MQRDGPPPTSATEAPAPSAPREGWALLKIAAAVYGAVVLFAIGLAFLQKKLPTLFGDEAPSGAHLVAGVGVGLALVALSRVAARSWPPMTRLVDDLSRALGPIALVPALGLALTSGVAEEILFRGALWESLGLLGTTLLFGVVHVWPSRAFWVYPVFAAVAGLLFGLLRLGTGSVWPPVLAHVTVNALNLVWLGRRARRAMKA